MQEFRFLIGDFDIVEISHGDLDVSKPQATSFSGEITCRHNTGLPNFGFIYHMSIETPSRFRHYLSLDFLVKRPSNFF
jgi:hypothetical protein